MPDSKAKPGKLDKPANQIVRSAERMDKSRQAPPPSPMIGIGTFGMIGWSVVVPTVGGISLGVWLDKVAPQTFSWTITLLFVGVVLGAAIAWRWVVKEPGGD
ncbi:MAG: AtpZ/AtpI family protein [Alphaproteobacteria bacterium]